VIKVVAMHYPRSQTRWAQIFWRRRRCAVCGLPWTCDEAQKERLRAQSLRVRNDSTSAWYAEVTAAYPAVGRAGYPTAAQAWRGHGGRDE
jgi:hypothetical protein